MLFIAHCRSTFLLLSYFYLLHLPFPHISVSSSFFSSTSSTLLLLPLRPVLLLLPLLFHLLFHHQFHLLELLFLISKCTYRASASVFLLPGFILCKQDIQELGCNLVTQVPEWYVLWVEKYCTVQQIRSSTPKRSSRLMAAYIISISI